MWTNVPKADPYQGWANTYYASNDTAHAIATDTSNSWQCVQRLPWFRVYQRTQ